MVNYSATGSSKSGFSLNITGINQTLRKLDLLLDGIDEEIDEILHDFTIDYHKEIVESAPFDTGTYSKNWYWNQTNIGKYIIYNDVSLVYNPGTNYHYSRRLTEKNNAFIGIASSGNYKYADPILGIIHDLKQIHFIMADDINKRIGSFTMRKVLERQHI